MKKLVFIFFIISATAFSQDVKVENATVQTINRSTSSTSLITYTITINKIKRSKWNIDSLINIATGDSIKYTIVKVDDPGAASPNYKKVNSFSKSDLGIFQISYGKIKKREDDQPKSPQNRKADVTTIEGGVYLYITTKNKHKRYKIDEFEKLETIETP